VIPPTETPEPTQTAISPTETPEPTQTVIPPTQSEIPPTETPEPTQTVIPTETVIVTALRARCGGHHSIMTNPTGQATGRMAIAGSGQLEWRELAHKSPEGHDIQQGERSELGSVPGSSHLGNPG
jgi:hypothetical protein